MDAQTAAVVFLVFGLALFVAEMAAPGLVLLPFGVGAVLASLTGFATAAPGVQTVVFIVTSIVAFAALRPIARRLNKSDRDKGVGARRLVASSATVLEDIPIDDSGMVRVGQEQWRAESADKTRILAGTKVTVVEVRGTRVLVTAKPPDHGR